MNLWRIRSWTLGLFSINNCSCGQARHYFVPVSVISSSHIPRWLTDSISLHRQFAEWQSRHFYNKCIKDSCSPTQNASVAKYDMFRSLKHMMSSSVLQYVPRVLPLVTVLISTSGCSSEPYLNWLTISVESLLPIIHRGRPAVCADLHQRNGAILENNHVEITHYYLFI